MHPVMREIVRFDGLEGARPDMEREKRMIQSG
jgi:hypothetical protein